MSISTPEPPQHVKRPALHDALREAEQETLAELDVVRDALRGAVDAVLRGDSTQADDVVAGLGDLERRYGDVHERLVVLIARQAPVAGDLRLAIALLHVNDRLERMGAQCANIAKLCRAMPADRRASDAQLECLAEMARLVDEQLAEAAVVLAERQADGLDRLRAHDHGINEHNRSCFSLAVEEGGDEARRESAFLVAMMARALERIGDNAVDVGRQAGFAVSGRLRQPTP